MNALPTPGSDDVDEVRRSYDLVAANYADLLRNHLGTRPIELAVLRAFADGLAEGAAVIEVGCGPGRIAGHLRGLGVDISGVDLSPGMVEVARRDWPDIEFTVGDLRRLEVDEAALGGVVAWYSLIHLPRPQIPVALTEFARVVRPGGLLLLAFQVGNDTKRVTHAYGHDIGCDAHRLDPDTIVAGLAEAGFHMVLRLFRAKEPPEPTRQAYLLARRTGQPG